MEVQDMPVQQKKPTVLVVDDTPESLAIAVSYLQSEYHVKVARSGARALQIAASVPHPDLVLLDVMMPEMDGYEVCRILKADPDLAHIPVIFLSAMSETDDVIRGFSLGAADYVSKPFWLEELRARVRTHLEIKLAQDTIRRKNEEQREMLHMLCHDLANPFANIISVLDVVGDDAAAIAEYVPLLKSSARSGMEVVDLVRLIRAVEEKPLPLGPVDLALVVAESLGTLTSRIREKNIRVDTDVAAGTFVIAERVSLGNSVLNNLLTNAIKFSHPGSTVELAAARAEGTIRITVRDHGVGMPPSLLADLFDVRKTTSRPGTAGERGTGFGMPLMRKLVTAYGGSIEVASKEQAEGASDHGTEVRVVLSQAPAGA
jgi:CheY-like chemotaxis protein/two-component sensor histidine kinase